MKCIICNKLNIRLICTHCQDNMLTLSPRKRELITNFYLYSFYEYDEIKDLIHAKYSPLGSQIYEILAKKSLRDFIKRFIANLPINQFDDEKLYVLPIDDNVQKGYSHSAILAKQMSYENIIVPSFNTLRANNRVKFANKSYAFRLQNPRDFQIRKNNKIKFAILVDDIVTSGLTILEAKDCLLRHDIKTLFAVALCDLGIKK